MNELSFSNSYFSKISSEESDRRPVNLIQQSLEAGRSLDAASLLNALTLVPDFDPVSGNLAYQKLVQQLQNESFFTTLKDPNKRDLLNNMEVILKCDQADAKRVRRLGEFQSLLKVLEPQHYVAASDLLVSLFGEDGFTRHAFERDSAVGHGSPNIQQGMKQNIQYVLQKWLQLSVQGRSSIMEQFVGGAHGIKERASSERFTLFQSVIEAGFDGKALSGDAGQGGYLAALLSLSDPKDFRPFASFCRMGFTENRMSQPRIALSDSRRRGGIAKIGLPKVALSKTGLPKSRLTNSRGPRSESLRVDPFQALLDTYRSMPNERRAGVVDLLSDVDSMFGSSIVKSRMGLVTLLARSDKPIESIGKLIDHVTDIVKERQGTLRNPIAAVEFQTLLKVALEYGEVDIDPVVQYLKGLGRDADLERDLRSVLEIPSEKREIYLAQAQRFDRPNLKPFFDAFDKMLIDQIEPAVSDSLNLGIKDVEFVQLLAGLSTVEKESLMTALKMGFSGDYLPKDYLHHLQSLQVPQWLPMAESMHALSQIFGHIGLSQRSAFTALNSPDRSVFLHFARTLMQCDREEGAVTEKASVEVRERLVDAVKLDCFANVMEIYQNSSHHQRTRVSALIERARQLFDVDITEKIALFCLFNTLESSVSQRLVKFNEALELFDERGSVPANHNVQQFKTLLQLFSQIDSDQFNRFLTAVRVGLGNRPLSIDYIQLLGGLTEDKWAHFSKARHELSGVAEPFQSLILNLLQRDMLPVARLLSSLFCDATGERQAEVTDLSRNRFDQLWKQVLDLYKRVKMNDRAPLVELMQSVSQENIISVKDKLAIFDLVLNSTSSFAETAKRVTDGVRLLSVYRYNQQDRADLMKFILRYGPNDLDFIFQQANRLGMFNAECMAVLMQQSTKESLVALIDHTRQLGINHSATQIKKLANIDLNRRVELLDAAEQIDNWNNNFETLMLLDTINDEDRDDFIQFTNRFLRAFNGLTNPALIEALMALPTDERESVWTLVEPFGFIGLDNDMLAAIVTRPPEVRPLYVHQRLGEILLRREAENNALLNAHADIRDNVHRSSRIKRVSIAFMRLIKKYKVPTVSDSKKILEAVVLKLAESKRREPNNPIYINAEKAITRSRLGNDFSGPLLANPAYEVGLPGLGQMAAMVKVLIDNYRSEDVANPKLQPKILEERNNLHFSFIKALAECLETDGHRVCKVGISQRLMSVLQGYYPDVIIDKEGLTPTPQYFNLLCREYNVAQQDLSIDDDPPRFYQYALKKATQYYGKVSEEYKDFLENQLNEFFKQSGYPISAEDK